MVDDSGAHGRDISIPVSDIKNKNSAVAHKRRQKRRLFLTNTLSSYIFGVASKLQNTVTMKKQRTLPITGKRVTHKKASEVDPLVFDLLQIIVTERSGRICDLVDRVQQKHPGKAVRIIQTLRGFSMVGSMNGIGLDTGPNSTNVWKCLEGCEEDYILYCKPTFIDALKSLVLKYIVGFEIRL